jgi:hypothetical protein
MKAACIGKVIVGGGRAQFLKAVSRATVSRSNDKDPEEQLERRG